MNHTDTDGLTPEKVRDASVQPLELNPAFNPNLGHERAAQLYEQLGKDVSSAVLYTPKFLDSLGPYSDPMGKASDEQRHHVIQDAAIRDQAGKIGREIGLAVNAALDLHKLANQVQASAEIGGTLKAEAQVAYNALRKMGADAKEAATVVITAARQLGDAYGWTDDTVLRVPGNRKNVGGQ